MNFEGFDMAEITIIQDPSSLSDFALAEQYQKLSTGYLKQKLLIDQFKQRIYTLEQEKRLMDNVLQDELQSVTENNDRELEHLKRKFVTENKDLHNRFAELNITIEKLELENEHLRSELKGAHKQPLAPELKACNEDEIIESRKRIEYLEKIEADHFALVDEIVDFKSEKSQLISQIMQIEKKLEVMTEYYECSQENLRCKTAELDDARNIIDSMQEKIIYVENELASHKNGDIDHNKKGNSLFAEVDDQRQQMRDVLNRQKQQYQMMKQKYSESNGEISRLKRENADMHHEIKECVNMFKNADKFHKSKLNEHIGFLKTENNRLTVKLKQTQLEMDSLARTQGVNWLSSMLEYCEHETKDLNQKLMSYGMKKCEAESLYAQAQELAAKWRFEALKSRCYIMNYEMLLASNNVCYEPKIQNIRQLVSKLYSSNAEPMIDDDLCSDNGDVNAQNFKSLGNRSDAEGETQKDGSWMDVREIFETFNKQISAESTDRSQQKDNLKEHKTDQSNLLLNHGKQSQNKDGIQNKMNVRKYANAEDTDKATENIKLNEDKENVNVSKERDTLNMTRSQNSSPPSNQAVLVERNSSDITNTTMSVPSFDNLNKALPPVNDLPNRVRQVNVEMFTVTLKRRDLPKED